MHYDKSNMCHRRNLLKLQTIRMALVMTLIHLSAPSAANLATIAISSVSLDWSN